MRSRFYMVNMRTVYILKIDTYFNVPSLYSKRSIYIHIFTEKQRHFIINYIELTPSINARDSTIGNHIMSIISLGCQIIILCFTIKVLLLF